MKADTPETVLLAVAGISPATLTETVWALAHENSEPLIPMRVVAVTTAEGRDRMKQLFQPLNRFNGKTAWTVLREALAAEGFEIAGRLRFGATPDDIRVITAHDRHTGCSRELDDIRTKSDNESAADFLLEQVRSFAENPDIRLVASIAGGRKTIGALLYACMTLVGRQTDRLTHVLVNEPFETLPHFFFPVQGGGVIKDRDGTSYDPSSARVELATVPFVPLRNLFMRELRQPAGSFLRLVETCRTNVRLSVGDRLKLEVETARPECRINGRALRLAPREHIVFLFFAKRAHDGDIVLSAYDEALVDLNEFRISLRKQAPSNDWSDWRHDESLGREIGERDLTRLISDVRAKARRAGGDAAYLPACLPEKGRCGLDIPPGNVTILEPEPERSQ